MVNAQVPVKRELLLRIPGQDLPGTTLSDATVPAPGAGFWYLSRGKNACGNGTYGTQSNGTPRTTTTCP